VAPMNQRKRRNCQMTLGVPCFSSSIRCILLGVLFSTFFLKDAGFVRARSLDSLQLALGEWNVNIKCGDEFFHSQLFPNTQIMTTRKYAEKSLAGSRLAKPGDKPWDLVRKRLLTRVRRHHCRMELFSNGTFALHPLEDVGSRDNNVWTRERESSDSILPIHGYWKVRPNPYCVTDRFYDDLLLVSFPRVEKEVIQDGKKNGALTKEKQRFRLECYCRLRGHFSDGGGILGRWRIQTRKRPTARLSRGTIVQCWGPPIKEGISSDQWRPIVVASFWGEGSR